MANTANGTSWDTSIPVLGSDRREGAQEIRGLRAGVGVRMNKEHIDMSGSTAPADGGEHIKGSGMAYIESSMSAHTFRPDGSTALTSQDEGRLGVDTGSKAIWYYNGSGWTQTATIAPNHTSTSIFTDVTSESGWTNGTGKNVLVTFNIQKSTNTTWNLVVTDSSDVEQIVMVAGFLHENRRHMMGACMVPIGKVLSVDPTIGGLGGSVTYSEL